MIVYQNEIDYWKDRSKEVRGRKSIVYYNRARYYEKLSDDKLFKARQNYLNILKSTPEITVQPVKGLWGEGYSLYNHWDGQWLTKPIKVCTKAEAEAWLKRIGGETK